MDHNWNSNFYKNWTRFRFWKWIIRYYVYNTIKVDNQVGKIIFDFPWEEAVCMMARYQKCISISQFERTNVSKHSNCYLVSIHITSWKHSIIDRSHLYVKKFHNFTWPHLHNSVSHEQYTCTNFAGETGAPRRLLYCSSQSIVIWERGTYLGFLVIIKCLFRLFLKLHFFRIFSFHDGI